LIKDNQEEGQYKLCAKKDNKLILVNPNQCNI